MIALSPEDIVQEVFYHFIKNNVYRQLSPEVLSTYLFRCVKNACLNKIRDQREFAQAELLRYDAVEEEAMTVSQELIEAIRESDRGVAAEDSNGGNGCCR